MMRTTLDDRGENNEMATDDEAAFWLRLSEESLMKIWDNEEDDVYAALLKEKSLSEIDAQTLPD
jgi:hypothetical protein